MNLLIPFLYELRSRKVPVGTQELLALGQALSRGLHDSSMDSFYHVARALMVHSEAHLDAFDDAFLSHFKGVERISAALHEELFDWLEKAKDRLTELTPEEQALFDSMDPEELRRLFEERLRDQKKRHDGGNKWIGTGGKSPFGNKGAKRPGYRVGGQGGNRSAIKVAGERRYRSYRNDLTLDTRQTAVALRKLRAFIREGCEEELDLEGTIDATARNAGELEVIMQPPRRPNTRVILMMDVGGSMEPYADLVSTLFSAASKSTHFKELRCYYFHNCVYGQVYRDVRFRDGLSIRELIAECGSHYKLIMVGDALMAPYELLQPNGSIYLGEDNRMAGISWLMMLSQHFERHCWLNPEDPRFWAGNTIEHVRRVLPMFQLTVNGLGEAVNHLTRGRTARRMA